jgi:hypothetical protein
VSNNNFNFILNVVAVDDVNRSKNNFNFFFIRGKVELLKIYKEIEKAEFHSRIVKIPM